MIVGNPSAPPGIPLCGSRWPNMIWDYASGEIPCLFFEKVTFFCITTCCIKTTAVHTCKEI